MKKQLQTVRNLIIQIVGIGLLTLGSGITIANAQNISATSYPVTFGTGATLVTVPGVNTQHVGSSIDEVPGPLTSFGSGFLFTYCGVQYSSLSVSADGFFRLGTVATPPFFNFNDLASTANTPIIAPFWGDLATGTTGQVRGFLTGIAPNRIYVIDWFVTIPKATGGAPNATFQCWLYENGGKIEFVYGAGITTVTAYSVGHAATAAFPTRISTATINSPFTSSTNAYVSVAPNNNNSSAIASGSYITYTPPIVNLAPSALNFTAVTGNSMTLNWADNAANEAFYVVQRSTDGGVNYTTLAALAANTTTYNATGLLPGQNYTFRVIAGTEGSLDKNVVGSQSTSPPAVIISTAVGGNWKDPLTWVGNVVPTANDSVIISNGSTVVIDTTAGACYALVVGQGIATILEYRATPAATLNVSHSIYIDEYGSFTAGAGTLTTHTLTIGVSATTPSPGNIVNNGTLDFFGTAGANITFFGDMDGSVTGAGVYDFRRITINKGNISVNRPVLTLDVAYTTEGANAIGMIESHTAGIFKIGGSFTQSNPVYNSAAYTIPLLGGIWLNNPNFTITALNGNPTNNGVLRVSQGEYNISTLATSAITFGTGSHLWIEGGVLNHAARISMDNIITFTMSGGVLNVAKAGNSAIASASFGLTNAASTVNWTGGRLVLNQRSTAIVNPYDYNVVPLNGFNGGILQIGNSLTLPAGGFGFSINGTVPNIEIDSISTTKTATLRLQTNVRGKIYIPVGCTLNLNGQNLVLSGDSVINNGFINGRTAASNFVFRSTTSVQYYAGTGVDTIQMYTNQNTAGGVNFDKAVVAYGATFSSTTQFLNSANIILGNGLAQAVVVQVGAAEFAGTAGIFDTAPILNLGTGTYSVSYAQEGAMRTTGIEIPVSRSVYNLTVSNTSNVTLGGGSLNITGTLTMITGKLNTSDANMLTVLNTAAAAVNIGNATSFVNGPMQRRLPPELVMATNYAFPIGKGSTYAAMRLINPKTNITDTVVILARYIDSATAGTPDVATLSTLPNNYYWAISIPSGAANLDSVTRVEFTHADMEGTNRIGYASTLSGTYVSKSAQSSGMGVIISDTLVGSASLEGYYTIGEFIIPISGNFLVGATKLAPDYTSITAFLADISGKQIQGNVILNLDFDYDPGLETFPITFKAFATNNPANTITVKPNTGVSTTIQGTDANAILLFNNNARNYVINGSNNGASSRDLTIINNSTAQAAVVRFIGTAANQGVQNTTLKNTIIKGGSNTATIGVLVGGTTLSALSNGLGYRNILIDNNQIYNTNYGIALSGTSDIARIKGISILNNYFGISIDSTTVRNRQVAIFTQHTDTSYVEKNTIFNQSGDLGFGTVTGIQISTNTSNLTVSKNVIHKLRNINVSGSGVAGIWVNSGTTGLNNLIVNNEVYDILSTNSNLTRPNSQYTLHGIFIQSGNDLKVYFNTVNLYGVTTIGINVGTYVGTSSGLSIVSNTLTGLDIRNNNIRNALTGFPGSKHYAVTHYGATSGAIFDYNNIFAEGSQGILAYAYNPVTATGVDQNIFADFKSTSAANANSQNRNPLFATDSTLVFGFGTIEGLGTPIAGITTDRVDSLRSNPPTIGAIEKGGDFSAPSITYTNLTNTFLLTNRVLSGFATITDYSGIDTLTNKPRLYYKKSTNTDVFGTYPIDNNNTFDGWKYAEATNTTSPFSFTIDYNLLFGGGITFADTIVYFVTAQDAKTPTSNITANPSAGFVATSAGSVTVAPTTPNRYIITYPPLAGTYLVGSAQISPNFTSITDAITALNTRGVSSRVIFELTDISYNAPGETFPIVVSGYVGMGSSNPVTIRPATGVISTITGNSISSIIRLENVNYFNINGSNNPDDSMDLTIENTNPAGSVIHIASLGAGLGSGNDSIANTRIIGNNITSKTVYGIFVGGTTLGTAGADNGFISIVNDSVYKVGRGISILGATEAGGIKIMPTNGIKIIHTTIGGNPDPGTYLYDRGIDINYATAPVIRNSTVSNVVSTANTPITAVLLTATAFAEFSNSKVLNIRYSGSEAYGSRGLHLFDTANTNAMIFNNFFADIVCDGNPSNPLLYNPWATILEGGSGHKVYHNTYSLTGNRGGNIFYPASPSAALFIGALATGLDIRNNIFQNTQTSVNTPAGQNYGIYSQAPITAFTNLDYNNYSIRSATGGMVNAIGFIDGISHLTLTDWKAVTGSELHSKTDSITFESNLDLHLSGTSIGNTNLHCLAIPGITTDIDNETRFSTPYMGADENVGSPLPVKLSAFTATTQSSGALLAWTTSSETNNKGFGVERSIDGRTFERVGFVKGAGNSNRLLNYGLTDAKAFHVTNSNILYYRLKQLDFDGKFTYSQVVRVSKNAEAANALSVYPNPYIAAYGISFTAAKEGVATIEMLDLQGKAVATKEASIVSGNNLVPMTEAASLNAGIYFVRLNVNGEMQVIKLVKN